MTRPDVWETHFFLVFGVIRYSLVTGEYSYVITPNFSDGFDSPGRANIYEIGFSNNSQWLAYAIKNGHSLDFVLVNLYSRDTEYFSVLVDEDTIYGDRFLSSKGWESNIEIRYSYFVDTNSGEMILNISTGEVTEVQ